VGFKIIVITNQPDIATGRTAASVIVSMHDKIRKELKVDDIRICTHVDADNCACRKPKPGMLVAAAEEWGIDLRRSYVVGDRWRDIEAGRAAGCLTLYVDYGSEQERPAEPDQAVSSLAEAARFILQREELEDER
jgi:D-glycero-D-manno-heptose 1,7-bisphosphate phosphatase